MRADKKTRKNSAVRKNRLDRPLRKFRMIFFVVLPLVLVSSAVYFLASAADSAFHIRKVVFTGSNHLTDEELRTLAGLAGNENLLTVSGGRIFRKMMESPWIRSVAVRKEFPGCLHILIKEAEPFALLDMKGRLFIVDEQGRMLEELKDSPIPFLPIIAGSPFEKKEVFSEAIHLAKAIKGTGLLGRKDHIEIIAQKPQEMSVNLDGVVVKVGTGEYEEKIGRLMELEEEIRRRQIPVDYIDLRFANKVVVKAVNEVIR